MISASVCLPLNVLLPLPELRNHIQFRADLGEQVSEPVIWVGSSDAGRDSWLAAPRHGLLGSSSLAVDDVVVSFHCGSPLIRIGGLDSIEPGLNRRFNLQLSAGHPLASSLIGLELSSCLRG
jgi:hypothetical protein